MNWLEPEEDYQSYERYVEEQMALACLMVHIKDKGRSFLCFIAKYNWRQELVGKTGYNPRKYWLMSVILV